MFTRYKVILIKTFGTGMGKIIAEPACAMNIEKLLSWLMAIVHCFGPNSDVQFVVHSLGIVRKCS